MFNVKACWQLVSPAGPDWSNFFSFHILHIHQNEKIFWYFNVCYVKDADYSNLNLNDPETKNLSVSVCFCKCLAVFVLLKPVVKLDQN